MMKAFRDRNVDWTGTDDLSVNTIRILAAEMVQKANSGHPGMPMGFALPAHVLWSRFLRFCPDDPFWPGRDRFVLSAGHGSALLYSLLHLCGYDLPMEQIKRFRQWESITPGHPEYGMTPGVETTAGPLGQGVGNGVGMAIAQRYVRETLGLHETDGFDPLDHSIFVVAGDGDLQEGVASEAASLAGHLKLGRLIILYDDNHITIDGTTELSWSEDVSARFAAYGWQTLRADGDDPQGVADTLLSALADEQRPSLIAVRTHIGHGSPNKQDTSGVHGAPLGEEELEATKKALEWTAKPFDIPDEVYSLYSEIADRGRREYAEWNQAFNGWLAADGSREPVWNQLVRGVLPADWQSALPEFEAGGSIATRAAAGEVVNSIASQLPLLVGGSADLAGSTKTDVKGAPDFLPTQPGGRNLRFGIREHAMGAAANGMALYAGLRPHTGTFLVFSDYMRPPLRLAAMMGLPVIFVFSHDSIGVGEDGPTHQPVEHIASLRAIPGLNVIRPCDATETACAFRAALENGNGPTAILTSRQGVPVIDRTRFASAYGLMRGGYVLADCEGTPQLVLIATGSEVSLALGAWDKLNDEGISTRVVSMPSWELFAEQDENYRDDVLPPQVIARVSIEAGISLGWDRWVGDNGIVICIERFGTSAPGKLAFEKFGFTVEDVITRAKSLI